MKLPEKNPVEWAVFGLSLLLVLAVGGVLAYEIVAGGEAPARLSVRPGEPQRVGLFTEIPVVVENQGDEAAEDVLVEVTVRRAGGAEDRAELSLPLLPRRGSREGVVTVAAEGAIESVQGRVVGYNLP